ncbi:hypothetical protein Pcinc_036257 [Petrolisthes cinctipes]|uniref:Hflx-type G domain-containing protein n=1 Tax=Petrolisthes cinctipes TaxID=88211 RepID=A0AAE1BUV7_PETCI|nr:hypothetical protein Pcinc_036418 [Petrolisthes cinctipes]KAK3857496.1 hypothetical protein Pcinc_036257 [Petrolisthes cinctipes]
MNNNSELISQYKEAFPAFRGYMECMSRTLFTGLASLSLAFGGTYVIQHLANKHLPYSRKLHIVVSSVVACGVAYQSRLQALATGVGGQVGVMVLQPWVKWGPQKRTDTSGQLMLQEAVALVSTLPLVSVVTQEVVSLQSLGKRMVFGSGTLERLVNEARANKSISCIFISLDIMKRSQIGELEAAFGIRIMDRYSVVLSIFHQHARTKEARLQVALAELPYIKKRVTYERDKLMVAEREKRLKAALTKLAGIRAQVRANRAKSSLPTIAVVGYTNAGKTSLIHAITQDSRAEGRNQLFATLDVTAHGCRLPCGVEVAFIDTVGFIQDIPTDLVASFKATLEDAIYSDVVVHVRDVSHPDYELQGATVSSTLASLPLPSGTPVITAANKMDLGITRSPEQLADAYVVSATREEGIEELLMAIQNEVLRVTGRKLWKFTLPTGSDQIQWLRGATGLVQEEIDEANPQITHVVAVLTDQELAAFTRNFGVKGKK